MTRLVLPPGKQGLFLLRVMKKLSLNSNQLGELIGISGRSMRYWIDETTIGEEVGLKKLSRLANIQLPYAVESRQEYWSAVKQARNGGLAYYRKYGPPGCLESRIKGGKTSQLRFRENPEFYKKLGCKIPNTFVFPEKSNPLFAEFVGILLGDGCITSDQVSITLNSIADAGYAEYIREKIKHLYGIPTYFKKRREANAIVMWITGRHFVEYLLKAGLKVGDKVKQQVDAPQWVKDSPLLSKWCLRGLMDTDGGIFTHTYMVKGKTYSYNKVNFTNKSQPLRFFVFNVLKSNGFNPKLQGDNKVWLYSKTEAVNYLRIIGSSNPRLKDKISMLE